MREFAETLVGLGRTDVPRVFFFLSPFRHGLAPLWDLRPAVRRRKPKGACTTRVQAWQGTLCHQLQRLTACCRIGGWWPAVSACWPWRPWLLGDGYGLERSLLFLLGAAIGLVLYHAAFGFASSWRKLLSEGRGEGLRAQMLMLAVATAIFLPLLEQGSFLGRPLGGAVAPVGVSVLMGACLFGIGMQLGGACASGTLYSLGGGSTRMVVTLIFFMVGSLVGSAHLPLVAGGPQPGQHLTAQGTRALASAAAAAGGLPPPSCSSPFGWSAA